MPAPSPLPRRIPFSKLKPGHITVDGVVLEVEQTSIDDVKFVQATFRSTVYHERDIEMLSIFGHRLPLETTNAIRVAFGMEPLK